MNTIIWLADVVLKLLIIYGVYLLLTCGRGTVKDLVKTLALAIQAFCLKARKALAEYLKSDKKDGKEAETKEEAPEAEKPETITEEEFLKWMREHPIRR